MLPFTLGVRNFLSIRASCLIPFSKKTTIIIGKNNSGKSNVLRACASVFNNNFNHYENNYCYDFKIDINYLKNFESLPPNLENISQRLTEDLILNFTDKGIQSENFPDALLSYVRSREYLNDFGSASSDTANKNSLLNKLFKDLVAPHLNGTVYVPNIRYITAPNQEPQNFIEPNFPGDIIGFGHIVQNLLALNNPKTEERYESRRKLKEIENFLSHCLDEQDIKLEIPYDKSTIHVKIGNVEHPLQSLGTGIEQLIIIGFASFGFPGKVVLIDEPELHFHVGTQKKMIQYLNEKIEAQFVIATHSPAIVDAIDADVLQITLEDSESVVKTLTHLHDRYLAVRDLGHTPSELLLTRFAIWVEGPSDRIYLNHWISKIDRSLKEGIDYSILFYGGKILSHHSFEDVESELVKATSLCREFAVVMDSDIHDERPKINDTKNRVLKEIKKQGGMCWITNGREVENYLPDKVISELSSQYEIHDNKNSFSKLIDKKKTDFARSATTILEALTEQDYEWPLDLKEKIEELVALIREAK